MSFLKAVSSSVVVSASCPTEAAPNPSISCCRFAKSMQADRGRARHGAPRPAPPFPVAPPRPVAPPSQLVGCSQRRHGGEHRRRADRLRRRWPALQRHLRSQQHHLRAGFQHAVHTLLCPADAGRLRRPWGSANPGHHRQPAGARPCGSPQERGAVCLAAERGSRQRPAGEPSLRRFLGRPDRRDSLHLHQRRNRNCARPHRRCHAPDSAGLLADLARRSVALAKPVASGRGNADGERGHRHWRDGHLGSTGSRPVSRRRLRGVPATE